ncbi:MAG: ABC transporter substrate-binding protein [Deltaproteobacteria bacterium]
MGKRKRTGMVLIGVGLLLGGAIAAAGAEGLTGAQKRGKRIYNEGMGRKPIDVFLAGQGIRGKGRAFPCVNCHRAGGRGGREGGVRSADISYFNLTKEYRGVRASGRAHPAYTDDTLRRAITSGVDPAGNRLNPAHPRFAMAREDLDDLLAYLKGMESETAPGVTDNAVRVGILFPSKGPLAAAAADVRALLSGVFREENARGGIYNRRLELVEFPFDPSVDRAALAAARAAVESDGVLCFLANIGVPTDGEAASYLAEKRVPVFAPLLAAPEGGYGADRYTFHVLPGIRDQARVMVDFLAESPKGAGNRLGILYAKDSSGKKGAEGAREQAEKRGLRVAEEISFAPGDFDASGAARRMGRDRVDAVLYFGGPAEVLAFGRGRDREDGEEPPLVAPAAMVGDALRAAPPGFLRRVYLASPLPRPGEENREAAAFRRIREKYSVGGRHGSFQLLAYAGTVLLEEGLRRSGRDVTRETLVGVVGNVRNLPTGVTAPLTYNANRRTGSTGAAIVRVDPATGRFVTVAEWREPR